MFRSVLVSLVISFLFVTIGIGQTRDVCITNQPKPELPSDYGTLDAITSIIFRVGFLADGQIGKVALVKSAHIEGLDKLASDAVQRIRFNPKMVDGSPVTTFKTVGYAYSWQNGWQVKWLDSQRACKPATAK